MLRKKTDTHSLYAHSYETPVQGIAVGMYGEKEIKSGCLSQHSLCYLEETSKGLCLVINKERCDAQGISVCAEEGFNKVLDVRFIKRRN